MTKTPKTLYDKVFDDHIVYDKESTLIYIDRHLVHEVTSPQAFEHLSELGRKVRRPDLTLATVDHNIPTTSRKAYKDVDSFISQNDSKIQCLTLQDNVKKFGLTYFGLNDSRQGIVHIIGPEQGFTLPGTTVVCGDSHTSTHGAFGALAFGIGTSEVEHVLATQTLPQKKSKNMLVVIDGELLPGVSSKDLILHLIGVIGTAGGTGHVIEYSGSVIQNLGMDARMSICNMTIEAGARAGMIQPDEITFEYLKGRPLAPNGQEWDAAVEYWKTLKSDPHAKFDKVVEINGNEVPPTVTWGTTPQDVAPINGKVPDPLEIVDHRQRESVERSLKYMGLAPNTLLQDISIDKVFIGSCTNGRIEDLRAAAMIAKGRKVAPNVKSAMVVPGSGLVKMQAEEEGLADIFIEAGFDWREPGCSMCLGMNEDQLLPEERCASTSNRNFEGRQGFKGRTHLMSPAMAAAAAIKGKLADVREFLVEHELVELDSKQYVFPFHDEDFKTSEDIVGDGRGATGMEPFTILTGIAAPLPMTNIDTDKIIPKQFLKTIKRTGLGAAAFFELRYNGDKENPEFVLNKEPWRQAKVLVTGANFGCGSSREHAPWALLDFGLKCIIAPSFADIFENNVTKNGMLPITLPQEQVDMIMKDAEAGKELTIDLPNQVIKLENQDIKFEINEFRKECLVNGLDDIGQTLQKLELIEEFESRRSELWPWLDGQRYGSKIIARNDKKARTDW